jgi:thiol-disulfide isomerase/thioredoxin
MTILLVASSEAQIAINITLKGLNGDRTKLADNIGEKIILINFWATWCLPCIKRAPTSPENL